VRPLEPCSNWQAVILPLSTIARSFPSEDGLSRTQLTPVLARNGLMYSSIDSPDLPPDSIMRISLISARAWRPILNAVTAVPAAARLAKVRRFMVRLPVVIVRDAQAGTGQTSAG